MKKEVYLELVFFLDQAESVRASNDVIEKARETQSLTAELQLFIYSIEDDGLKYEASRLLGDLVNQPNVHIGDKILIVKLIQALKQLKIYAEEFRVKDLLEKQDKIPMKNNSPTIGSLLHTTFNEFKLLKQIGNGGAGTVYEAQDIDGVRVAVKILKPGWSTEQRKRFKNEIGFCQKNIHPGVIQIIAHGIHITDAERYLFYVMPLHLFTFREHMKNLKPDECLPYIVQVLQAIEAAHLLKCYHRDLKPENILVKSSRNEITISDFGIAHFDEPDLLTDVQTKQGSRLANFIYAAPEQKIKGSHVDHRADIYALGMIFNEMFTGEQPHGHSYKKVAEVSPIHGYFDSIFDKMMHTKPENRYQDIATIKYEISLATQIAISQQKINNLNNTVVISTDPNTDPLVSNPLKIEKSDHDGTNLICQMNQKVSNDWFYVLKSAGGANSYSSMTHWRNLLQNGDKLIYRCSIDYAVQTKRFIVEWIENTNRLYSERVARKLAQQAQEEKHQAEQTIAFEQKRQLALKNLNS